MRRHLFFRAARVSYAALTLIPVSFSAASAASFALAYPAERTKALAFWSWTGFVSLPLSVILFSSAPFVLLFDPVDRTFFNSIQQSWARLSLLPFARISVHGPLPPKNAPVVVVSNHSSVLDPYVLMSLGFPCVFVARREIFFIPLVGWVMSLIGHLRLIRGDSQSGKSVLDQCVQKLQNAKHLSIVFFAEGSRLKKSGGNVLGDFKMGAFNVARKSDAPIVPVSISGTQCAMPAGMELEHFALDANIHVELHAAVLPSSFEKVTQMRDRVKADVQSGLL